MNNKFVLSFSGGKDSIMAMYRMIQKGYEPYALIMTVKDNGNRSWTHSIEKKIIDEYRKKLGVRIDCVECGISDYEKSFEEKLIEFRQEGVNICVFGDIDIEEHLRWNIDRCKKAGMTAVMPLENIDREKAVMDFIDSGFDGIIKKVNTEYLDDTFLGLHINKDTIEKFRKKEIDLCGENGEYHTIVVSGPLFKERIDISPQKDDSGEIIIEREYNSAILKMI